MSAFRHNHGDCFDLTGTTARRWHRHAPEECQGSYEADLEAAGLTVESGGSFWHVRGPGVVRPVKGQEFVNGHYNGSGPIWTALSGLPSSD